MKKIKSKRLTELLNKHGICVDCGEMYSPDIDEPLAHCKCHSTEWYTLTPYMTLQKKLWESHQHEAKLKEQIAILKEKTHARFNNEECWIYSLDEDNHLESLEFAL